MSTESIDFSEFKTEVGKHSKKSGNKKPNLKQELTINLIAKIISSKTAKKVLGIFIFIGVVFSIIGVVSTIHFLINL